MGQVPKALLKMRSNTCLMTKHKVLLKLETTVSMTAYDDGVVAVGVQVAQVSSSLVIPDVVLPPL